MERISRRREKRQRLNERNDKHGDRRKEKNGHGKKKI